MREESDLKFVQEISAAAQSRKLDALLIGGHAVNLHGVSRFTEDFDFLIDRANVASWRELLRSERSESLRIVSAEHLVALKLHALKQELEHRRLRDFLDVVDVIKKNRLDLHSAEMKEVFEKFGTPE